MKRFLFIMIPFLVVISVIGCSNETIKKAEENWEESPALIRDVIITDDGETGDFIFRIGDNGKLGFGEYGQFIAGESQKYMWHFWGDKDIITKPFKVDHKDFLSVKDILDSKQQNWLKQAMKIHEPKHEWLQLLN